MAFEGFRNVTLSAALLIGMVACGGGTQLAGGGIGGTGISQGPITGFGSIFVNGVEYDTTHATVIKDGSAATQGDLQIGMVVTVDGSIDSSTTGTAATVTYAKELEGPITAVTTNSLTVLGQTVVVDNLTKIVIAGLASPSLSDLHVNDTVEVSGLLNSAGLRATYIAKKPSRADVELKGVITATGVTTLTVGAQTVDIGGLVLSFTPALGDYVEVKGTLNNGALVATSVERESRSLGDAHKDNAELKGFVTDFTSGSDFVVNAQRVQTSQATGYKGGTAADIKPGVLLEVEGQLANGVLLATKVSFEDNLVLEGTVAVFGGGALTLVEYPDFTIEINPTLTSGAGLTISGGSYVRIHGRPLEPGCATAICVLATELETPGTTTEAELQGAVTAVSAPSITVMGVTVDTSGFVDHDFSGAGVTGRTSFFNTIKVGDLVEVSGTRSGATVTWNAIGLED